MSTATRNRTSPGVARFRQLVGRALFIWETGDERSARRRASGAEMLKPTFAALMARRREIEALGELDAVRQEIESNSKPPDWMHRSAPTLPPSPTIKAPIGRQVNAKTGESRQL